MNTTIATPMNDIYGDFESNLDPFFTSAVEGNKWGKYSSWDKDQARSALSTTRRLRPPRWSQQGILGVSSPVKKI